MKSFVSKIMTPVVGSLVGVGMLALSDIPGIVIGKTWDHFYGANASVSRDAGGDNRDIQRETERRLNEMTERLNREVDGFVTKLQDTAALGNQSASASAVEVVNEESSTIPTVATVNPNEAIVPKIEEPTGNGGSLAVSRIFEGQTIDLCGYRDFTVKIFDEGARFELYSNDRSLPEREFTGWRRVVDADQSFSISPECRVAISSEEAGGSNLIYFEIIKEPT